MLRKKLRLVLAGTMAVLCALCALTATVFAQAGLPSGQEVIEPPAEHESNTGKFAPLDWTPGTEHPGKSNFDKTCRACHQLSDVSGVGPGLADLASRVPQRERLLKFITNPRETVDEYFVELRDRIPGEMLPMGGGTFTEQEILEIIDYIFRHRDVYGPPPERKIEIGRRLASGARKFENGAPACIGCHTIGADKNLRGANVGPNIAHTWVLARDAAALGQLLAGPDGPAMHAAYRKNAVTGEELDSLITFFERAARDTGTERQSNFLPIFALILATLGVFVLDGSLFGRLFVEEDHEFVDGPYAEEQHH